MSRVLSKVVCLVEMEVLVVCKVLIVGLVKVVVMLSRLLKLRMVNVLEWFGSRKLIFLVKGIRFCLIFFMKNIRLRIMV